ncbi:MAG: polysaccharide deacetylase family protein [Gemmatimonadota bacterium]
MKANFDVVGLDELPEALRSSRDKPALITFDDGYRDNAEVAFPILRGHRAPATFFVTTGFIDTPSLAWWDLIALMLVRAGDRAPKMLANVWQTFRQDSVPSPANALSSLLRIYKGLPGDQTSAFLSDLRQRLDPNGDVDQEARAIASNLWMDWSMIRHLKSNGMSVGGHTVTHPVLARLTPEAQLAEIAGCRARLAEELSEAPIAMSYPVGCRSCFDEVTRRAMTEAGFAYGFSYYGGTQQRTVVDVLDMHRTAVEHDFTFDRFVAVCGWPQLLA